MSGIQLIQKTLPKTGTQVITTIKDGLKVAKTVIPGAGNSRVQHINHMTTTFANGKAQSVTMSQDCGLGLAKNLVSVLNKTWEKGRELFKMVDFIKP